VRERAVFSSWASEPRGRVASTGDLALASADVEEYLPGEVFDPSMAYAYLPELATTELAARIAADAGVYPPGAYPAAP
jgi:hypothetical protein